MADKKEEGSILRKVLNTVIVYRDGDRIRPKVGSIFAFTPTEYKWLNKNSPESIGKPIVQVEQGESSLDEDERTKLISDTRAQMLLEQEQESKKNTKSSGSAKNQKDEDI